MQRLSRIDAPGVIHHVIIRGEEKGAVFRDQFDCEDFIRRLDALIPETRTHCYAGVLMSNHAHFLFRSGLCRQTREAIRRGQWPADRTLV
jgi:REP element-mobilizing transposase RayT